MSDREPEPLLDHAARVAREMVDPPKPAPRTDAKPDPAKPQSRMDRRG